MTGRDRRGRYLQLGDQRGVSEVIGFVIVFGIIIGSVGILYTFGFQSMNEFQEGEQLRNAERAFDALGENLNDVEKYDGIERRSGELSLREGTLRIEDEGVTFAVEDGTKTDRPPEDVRALTYEFGDSIISYTGGGVFRAYPPDDASIAVREPTVQCDGGVVSLVVIENDQPSLQATSTQVVAMGQVDTEVYRDDPTVEFDIGGSNEHAWDRLVDDPNDCNPDVVRVTTVQIEYDG